MATSSWLSLVINQYTQTFYSLFLEGTENDTEI